jgi:hypothetical protein
MEAKGIDAENLEFSGFWSQGDGASFEGRVNDWPKFFAAHNLTDQYPCTLRLLELKSLYLHFKVVRSSGARYSHEYTMLGDVEQFMQDAPPEEPLLRLAYEDMVRNAEREIDGAEAQFQEIFRGHARILYRRLEEQYDYETSEEAILETLYENELLEEELTNLENEDDTDED